MFIALPQKIHLLEIISFYLKENINRSFIHPIAFINQTSKPASSPPLPLTYPKHHEARSFPFSSFAPEGAQNTPARTRSTKLLPLTGQGGTLTVTARD
jgi:hypothetical protein